MKVHRELSIAFIPNPECKPCVNHKDGNKINNHLDNLEWVTVKENTIHARDNGLLVKQYGEENGKSILTESLIFEIKSQYIPRHKQFGLRALAKKYGTSHSTLSNAFNGVTWKKLNEN